MTMAYNLKQIRRTHWRGTTTRSYEACHTRHVIRHVIQNHKVIQGTSYEACHTARHTEPQGHTRHVIRGMSYGTSYRTTRSYDAPVGEAQPQGHRAGNAGSPWHGCSRRT